MVERRNIGQILVGAGRVTMEDVERALDYQREHGGYMGEALVALGALTQEELEYSLASQYDMPYVFPDADSIDPEAAALVTPEWALAHLALPIMKTSATLTVVVDSPLASRAVEELQARTDLEIQLALASSWKIRELIRQVYSRHDAKDSAERAAALKIDQAMGLALDAASRSFGVSARGSRVWFWYEDAGSVKRRPLDGRWRDGLDKLISPPLSQRLGDQPSAALDVELNREGLVSSMELRYLATSAGQEYVFKPKREPSRSDERFPPPSQGLLTEIRLLARSGSARFLVRAPEQLGREIVPHLPSLLLDPSWRSVHVSVQGGSPAGEEVFGVEAPSDRDAWGRQMETLRTFHFDAVSVDPSGAEPERGLEALDVASVAFILWDEKLSAGQAHEAGVRWALSVERAEGQSLEWRLDPLHV